MLLRVSVTTLAQRTVFAVVTLICVSCSTMPPARVSDAVLDQRWHAHRQSLQHIAGWRVTGRVAVHTPDNGWNASVLWDQIDASRYTVKFSGPFRQGVAALQVTPDNVTLSVPDRPVMVAGNAETLLRTELGWEIPMNALRFWMVGLPANDSSFAAEFDNDGRLTQLTQSGWRTDYQRYVSVDNMTLPARMQITNGEVKLRFIIDRWSVAIDSGNEVQFPNNRTGSR